MSVQSAHLPYYYLNFRLQVFIFSFVIIRYNIFFIGKIQEGSSTRTQRNFSFCRVETRPINYAAASTESGTNANVPRPSKTTGRK